MPAPKGNNNAAKGKEFRDSLRKALKGGNKSRLVAVTNKLIECAENGEGWAIREIADRLDGKPSQQVDLGSSEESPFQVQIISFTEKQ